MAREFDPQRLAVADHGRLGGVVGHQLRLGAIRDELQDRPAAGESPRHHATITEAHNEYAHNVVQMLKKQGIRVEADLRNEKINRKIREHTMQKTPYIAVIGDAERDANQVAVRLRGNENLGSLPVDEFIQRLLGEINSRA